MQQILKAHMHTDHLTTLLRSSLEPISVGWGQVKTHVLPEESAHTHTHKHIAKGFLSPRSALHCSLQPAICLASHFSQVSQPRYTSLFTNQHLCLLQPRIEWLRYYRVWSVLFFEVKGDSLWSFVIVFMMPNGLAPHTMPFKMSKYLLYSKQNI